MKKIFLFYFLSLLVLNSTKAQTCIPDITITGPYTITYTKSATWIKTSGVTTIPGGADVTLDANPLAGVDGYVLLEPGFETLPNSIFLAIVQAVCIANPLPVKLISFSAKAQENQVLLNWETSSEINSSGFEIERSENGKEFSKIGFVKSDANNGNSNEKLGYEFIDASTSLSNQLYYRLKQLDLDGKFEYSQIKSVKLEGKGVVNIFPNPTSDFITIEVFGDKIKSIELLNANGSILYQSNSVENRIDVSKHPSGIYLVKIVNTDGKVEVRRVLKN